MNQKGFANVILAAAIIMLGVAGYFFFVKQSQLQQILTGESTNSITKWETVYNNALGFSVQYPPDWEVNIKYDTTHWRIAPVGEDNGISLYFYQNPKQLPLAQWVQQERILVSKMIPITINGMTAMKGKESGLLGYDAVYFGRGTVIVSIFAPENSQYSATFEAMLPTFKFNK